MRTTTKSLAVTASLLLVLVLSSAAAGATRNSTPRSGSTVFCGSVVTWEKTVKTQTHEAQPRRSATSRSTGKVDIPTAKTKLVGFLTKVVHSTDTMVSADQGRRRAERKNGAKIQSGVVSAFTQLRKAFQDAKVAATKLPTNSAKAFSSKANALAKTIQSSANRIGVAFRALDKYSTDTLQQRGQEGHGLPASRRLTEQGTTLPKRPALRRLFAFRARGARASTCAPNDLPISARAGRRRVPRATAGARGRTPSSASRGRPGVWRG